MSDDIVDLLLVTIPIEASQQEYLTFEQVVMRDAADEIKRLRDSVAEVDKLRQRISELEDRVSDLEQSRA